MADTMKPSYEAGAATHGSMMFLVFGVFMPASIMSARYLRRFPKTGPVRYWWGVHAIFNALAGGLFLVAWTIAVYIAGGAQFTNSHKKLGLAILVIIIFQFFYGAALSALHSFRPHMKRNNPLEWLHWALGYILLILGWVNIPLGLYRAAPDYETSKTIHILYFVWFGFLVLGMLAMEATHLRRGGNTMWKEPLLEKPARSNEMEHQHSDNDVHRPSTDALVAEHAGGVHRR